MITTLPITPNPNGRFQTLLSAFVASLYASFASEPAFLSLNLIGERVKTLDDAGKEKLLGAYREYCRSLGYSNLRLWADNDPLYADYVSRCIEYLRTEGVLYDRDVPLLLCPCGAVEILATAELLSAGAKTYTFHSGQVICKLCDEAARQEHRHSLLLRLPLNSSQATDIYPAWTRNEARELWKKFSTAEILVSRSGRKTAAFNEKRSGFPLDPDFFWSMFATYLAKKESTSSVTLITSNRTMRQALRVSQMAKAIESEMSVTIIVNPIFRLKDGAGSVIFLSIDDFCHRGRAEISKYLFALSLQWRSKEVILETSRQYWIEHSIYPETVILKTGDAPLAQDIEEFLRTCSRSTTEKLVSKLRKKQALDIREKRLYDLLHK